MTFVAAPARSLVARDVMSAPTVSITPSTSVWSAWSLMMRTGLRHLVVAVNGHCVGVIDDRIVFAEWPMGPLALRRRTVQDLVRPGTTGVLPDTDIQLVARVMVADNVDAVPVVTADGLLVGIVTASDITGAVAANGVRIEEES